MPTPNNKESKSEFVSRCIPYVIKEGKTPEQAAGQCYGMWESHKKKAGASVKTIDGEEYVFDMGTEEKVKE